MASRLRLQNRFLGSRQEVPCHEPRFDWSRSLQGLAVQPWGGSIRASGKDRLRSYALASPCCYVRWWNPKGEVEQSPQRFEDSRKSFSHLHQRTVLERIRSIHNLSWPSPIDRFLWLGPIQPTGGQSRRVNVPSCFVPTSRHCERLLQDL